MRCRFRCGGRASHVRLVGCAAKEAGVSDERGLRIRLLGNLAASYDGATVDLGGLLLAAGAFVRPTAEEAAA